MTVYSPSGAPGSEVAVVTFETFRDFRAPSGCRRALHHLHPLLPMNVATEKGRRSVQLWAYFWLSINWSHSPRFSEPRLARVSSDADGRRRGNRKQPTSLRVMPHRLLKRFVQRKHREARADGESGEHQEKRSVGHLFIERPQITGQIIAEKVRHIPHAHHHADQLRRRDFR